MSAGTYVPERYPAGHPEAGRIVRPGEPVPRIVDPAEAEERAALEAADQLEAERAAQAAQRPADASGVRENVRRTRPGASGVRPVDQLMPDGSVRTRPADASGVRETVRTIGPALALGLLAALAIFALGRNVPAAPPAAAPLPTVPPSPVATLAATSGPTLTSMPPDAAPRALVAYFDYMDGETAVPVERGTTYTPIARAGDRWVRVRLADGAEVWAVAEDLGIAVDPALPDLSPRPTAIPSVPPAAAPAAPAAPPACREAVVRYQVMDAAGVPIGEVEGRGCSQAAAQAEADRRAEALQVARGGTP